MLFEISLEYLQNQMTRLTRFMYESAQEHRQNYAAINAQLHLINERLRSPDSSIGNSGSVSNLKIKRELLRCISREKSKVRGINGQFWSCNVKHYITQTMILCSELQN